MSPEYARLSVVAAVMVSGFTLLWQQHETTTQDMRARIDRLEQGKAEKSDAADRWRRSEEMEYQKRVDSEVEALRGLIDELKACNNPCRRKP